MDDKGSGHNPDAGRTIINTPLQYQQDQDTNEDPLIFYGPQFENKTDALLMGIRDLLEELIRNTKMNALEFRIITCTAQMERIAESDRFGTGLSPAQKARYAKYEEIVLDATKQLAAFQEGEEDD